MPGDSGVTCMLVCALPLLLHTRPRAHRPPGIPCALCLEGGNKRIPRAKKACGEIAEVCLNVIGLFEKLNLKLRERIALLLTLPWRGRVDATERSGGVGWQSLHSSSTRVERSPH